MFSVQRDFLDRVRFVLFCVFKSLVCRGECAPISFVRSFICSFRRLNHVDSNIYICCEDSNVRFVLSGGSPWFRKRLSEGKKERLVVLASCLLLTSRRDTVYPCFKHRKFAIITRVLVFLINLQLED